MADIEKMLKTIMEAEYGEEVRASIHDAIKAGNDEIVGYGLKETERQQAEAARGEAEAAREEAEEARETVRAAMEAATAAANEAAENANGVAEGGLPNRPVSFSAAPERKNIESGETVAEIAGKVKKYFADLGTAAFDSNENIVLKAYPVGSIYMSVKSTNPGTLFGGTWAAWGQGRVPIGVSAEEESFSAANKTGGSRRVTIINKNLPAQVFTLYNAPSGVSGNYAEVKVNSAMSGYVATQISTRAGAADQPIDITPRYITCYMWQRTA